MDKAKACEIMSFLADRAMKSADELMEIAAEERADRAKECERLATELRNCAEEIRQAIRKITGKEPEAGVDCEEMSLEEFIRDNELSPYELRELGIDPEVGSHG